MAGVILMAKIPGEHWVCSLSIVTIFLLLTTCKHREKVPPRPQGQRAEPTTNNPFSGPPNFFTNIVNSFWALSEMCFTGFGFGGGQPGGFHMSFGIGGRSDEHGNGWISDIFRDRWWLWLMLVIWNLQEPFLLDSLQPTSTLARRGPGHHRFFHKMALLATNYFLCNHNLCCQAGSHQAAEEAFLHKIFLWVTFVMQHLKRWRMAKPFRWRLPSYSGYWSPENGEGKNFTGHVLHRYLKVMKLDIRGEDAE